MSWLSQGSLRKGVVKRTAAGKAALALSSEELSLGPLGLFLLRCSSSFLVVWKHPCFKVRSSTPPSPPPCSALHLCSGELYDIAWPRQVLLPHVSVRRALCAAIHLHGGSNPALLLRVLRL